jgi:hypothetical protein
MKKHTPEQMKTLYRQAFGGLNDAVLEDIGKRFWANDDMLGKDIRLEDVLYREGQRSVYLHIKRMIADNSAKKGD